MIVLRGISFLYLTVVICVKAVEIENLNELYDAIVQGPNRKVGFLSSGNYQVVKNTLPATVEPVYVNGVDLLSAFVNNGTFLAGLVTQVPPTGFNQFSSGIISPQAMIFASNSSSLLRQAIGSFQNTYGIFSALTLLNWHRCSSSASSWGCRTFRFCPQQPTYTSGGGQLVLDQRRCLPLPITRRA